MIPRDIGWSDLMRAANAGDAAAYQRVLCDIAAALRPLVRRGLTRAGRSSDETEDVVQEVLLAVHLKRHTWDGERPIEPWVRAIAHYKLIDALRRRGSHRDLPIDIFAETLAVEEPGPAACDRDVARHLATLPAGQRAVVQAIAVEGASIDETAARLTLTPGAVRVALHRGLTALARTVDDDAH